MIKFCTTMAQKLMLIYNYSWTPQFNNSQFPTIVPLDFIQVWNEQFLTKLQFELKFFSISIFSLSFANLGLFCYF